MPVEFKRDFGVTGREAQALRGILDTLGEHYEGELPFMLDRDSLTIKLEQASLDEGLEAILELKTCLHCAGYGKLSDKVFDRMIKPLKSAIEQALRQ